MSTVSISRRESASRILDYVELAKPRIGAFVFLVVLASCYIATSGSCSLAVMFAAAFGTLLVGASASAMNHWIERNLDRRMVRTANRPIASGRVSSTEALLFATATFVAGSGLLLVTNNPASVLWGAATWAAYVLIYTPMKTLSSWNTWFGAVAGAMPVLMGWSATGAELNAPIVVLFAILVCWQLPHFMAIAWLYRDDYEQAGHQMATVVDKTYRLAAWQAISFAIVLALLPLGLLAGPRTAAAMMAGGLLISLAIGQGYFAWRFFLNQNERTSRQLLLASLIYLPATLPCLCLAAWPAL
ncbi:heme o synthase [Anatilimnocola floriformis]|uniref:heme o synthase n=1 Tax=Anatilimnocola floriformis TaxID=2948575 RepID=UPI0020C43DA7|nr:heme o synthase [Anatilimnocola floriformis]